MHEEATDHVFLLRVHVRTARNKLNDDTARALLAYCDVEQKLRPCSSVLTSAPRELDAEQARLANLEEQRAIVLAKQTELEHAVANALDWRLAGDARARDTEYERQRTLRMQLQRLREGTLFFAPNQAYARVSDLDARIKESSERVARLRTQLATNLEQAEALLAESVTG